MQRAKRQSAVGVLRPSVGTVLGGCILLWCGPMLSAAERPNLVVVLADDLGYGDLGCYGNTTVNTPHIDRLAEQSLRFTSCYAAAANCSPSRAGLMTGRSPYRLGIYNWIPLMSPMHVRREVPTIARVLRDSGYTTCHVGKWHLNGGLNLPDQPQPSDMGFDHWFSTQNNALPCHRNPDNFVRDGRPVGPLKGFSAQLVVDEAIGWLEKQSNGKRPFFLFVCFHEPHEPIAAAHRYTDLYSDQGPRSPFDPQVSTLAAHHGSITQMDDAFGRLIDFLDRQSLADTTWLFFTSDNGPAITRWHPHGSAGPLRDKKGSMYEGGIRVPGIVRWPGHIRPGTSCDQPVSGVDLFPTLCELAQTAPPQPQTIDGTSLAPLFGGQPLRRRRPLYWQFDVASSRPKVALRAGPWKLLAGLTGPPIKPFGDLRTADMQQIKTAGLRGFELYRLDRDIGETNDVSAEYPEQLNRLRGQMQLLHRQMQAEGPVWPAWKFPGLEGQRIRAFRESLK